jgi:hypothetical protein
MTPLQKKYKPVGKNTMCVHFVFGCRNRVEQRLMPWSEPLHFDTGKAPDIYTHNIFIAFVQNIAVKCKDHSKIKGHALLTTYNQNQ